METQSEFITISSFRIKLDAPELLLLQKAIGFFIADYEGTDSLPSDTLNIARDIHAELEKVISEAQQRILENR